jgi:hypothetical protein
MTATYERLVPEETRAFVAHCVNQARENIERDGFLEPVALIGRFAEEPSVIAIGRLGVMPKDIAARLIRQTAHKADADFVLHIDEVWTANLKTRDERKQYGQVRDIPGRIDAVMFALHTHIGTFVALTERVTVDAAKKRYTFGAVDLDMMKEGEGRFVGLLPPRGKKQ